MIEQFYVAIDLARGGRISIAIQDFYVAIELATTESFAAHDRVGCAKTGGNDSVALCCVAIEEAMHARQTRPGGRDRPGQVHIIGLWCTRQSCARDKGILLR